MVRVTSGIAVNRQGEALCLPSDIDLSLARQASTTPVGTTATTAASCGSPSKPGEFDACSGLPPGAPLVATGIYLITVAPASRAVGRAPVGGLGNVLADCGIDATAEGVQFRLVRVDVPMSVLADQLKVRSRLAHLMFGTDDPNRHRLEIDPFGEPSGPIGLLERMRADVLVDDEVPLACLHWIPGRGIRFIDEWCVRRSVSARGLESDWPEVTGNRRRLEGEAMFQQFQVELAALATGVTGPPDTLSAADCFHRLPPAGFLPIASSRFPRGFDLIRFFDGMTTRPATSGADPIFADAARVRPLLLQSFLGLPIDPASDEFIWMYAVRQNVQSGDAQPFVMFASGFLPYIADSQFDLSTCDFSNYALHQS
jgi:hypothetical protein